MDAMDAALLSRIQFGFTVGFHILFPTFTIGLALFLASVEALWLKTQNEEWRSLYRFWVKVFALTFGMGVVSGLVLSYEFGTNFSAFSEATAPVLGPLLSVEVLTAFFVEAGFLGIMLFGWDKVGPRLHFLATVLVALGTLNSAFWILSANSWMQTPAGFEFNGAQFIPTDWAAIIFNPSFPYRLVHMVLAALLTTSLAVAGISAWQILNERGALIAKRGFFMGIAMMAIAAPAQIFAGDLHGLQVRETQPIKVAAMEGLWHTTKGAPLVLFGLPDMEDETNHFEIEIPKLASLILTHEWDGEVQGLTSVRPEDRPNVPIVFWSFRIMVGLGFLFLAYVGGAIISRVVLKRWHPLALQAAVPLIPLGFVATIAGWLVAEVGRQPWTVYGMMRTHDSVSPVSAEAVMTSLIAFIIVYGLLGIAYLYYVSKLVRHGPQHETPQGPVPEAMRGARPGLALKEELS